MSERELDYGVNRKNAGAWRNRIVGEGEKRASEFQAHPLNWRAHPQSQSDALKGALNEVGWVQRVILNRQTGRLIDGHERVRQALDNGDALVPYLEVDLSEEEESYVLATLDPLSAMALADQDALASLLDDVATDSAAVATMLGALLGEDDDEDAKTIADRSLQEIDVDRLPVKPVWCLLAIPTERLPDVTAILISLEQMGISVEMSDD